MNKNQSRILSVAMPLAFSLLSGFGSAVYAQSFIGVRSLPGGEELSSVFAVSDNGLTIVGETNVGELYHWSLETLFIREGESLEFQRLDNDGGVVVGRANTINGSFPFRWTVGNEFEILDNVPDLPFWLGQIGNFSSNGLVNIGSFHSYANGCANGGSNIYRWTDNGIQWLDVLPEHMQGDCWFSQLYISSGDGSTIYGRSFASVVGDFASFKWKDGVLNSIGLDLLSSGIFQVSHDGDVLLSESLRWTETETVELNFRAGRMNYDGSVIIGSGISGTGQTVAIRWESDMKTELGFLSDSPDTGSVSGFLDNDGSVIVGISFSTKGIEQFVWTLEKGMRSFAEIFGVDSLGWSDVLVDGISGDGTTLFGRGVNPDGIQEGWIATLGDTNVLEFAAGVCENTGSPTASWHTAETWSPNGLPTSEIDVRFIAECLPTPEEPFVAIFDELGEAKSVEVETGVDATLKGLVPFLTTESITVNGTLGLDDRFQLTTDQITITAEGTLRVVVDSPSGLPSELNGPVVMLNGGFDLQSIDGTLEIQIDPAILSDPELPAGSDADDAPKWPLFIFESGVDGTPPNFGRFHTVRVTDLSGNQIPQSSNGTIGVMYSTSGIDLVVLNTPRTVATGEGWRPFATQPITDWATASNVTLITHGTNSVPDEWVSTLAAYIDWKSNVPGHSSAVFDWSQDNLSGGISDLLGGAGNTSRRAYELGESIAFWVDQCRDGIPLNSIHIHGHSSGAWFTEGFAARYSILQPSTFIESTMYDANDTFDNRLYEPNESHRLGFSTDFATHVVDRRSLVCGYESLGTDSTAHIFPYALNLDVTPADILADNPVCESFFCGLEDIECRHAWPYNWYQFNLNDLPTQAGNDGSTNSSDPLYWGFMRTFARNSVQPMYQVNMPAMGSTISIYPNLSMAILMEDLFAVDLDYVCESGCCDVINGSFVMAPTCGGAGRGGQIASTTIVINASMPLAAFSFDLNIAAPGAILTASIGGEEFSIDMPSVIAASLPAYIVFDPPLAAGNHDLVVNADFAYGLGEVALSNLALDLVDSSVASCPADLTGEGVLNFFDVSAFLQGFGNQDPVADFTGDGIWNFFDVSAFLQAFSAGCP